MSKNSNKQYTVNIIYPKNLAVASSESLALCEMLINALIKAKSKEFYCKLNTDLGYIECDVIEVKKILTLLLKTKKIKNFYDQFTRLLHKADDNVHPNCLGQLMLESKNFLFDIFIIEECSFPDFKWRILKRECF